MAVQTKTECLITLETIFSAENSQINLETVIDWGRYAELYSYDESRDEILLEPSSPLEQEVKTVS